MWKKNNPKSTRPPEAGWPAEGASGALLHGHRLRQIARLIDVGALEYRGVVGEQLHRNRGEERRQEGPELRDPDDGVGPVVGTRTAGAVVGGSPTVIRPGMLLYIAVLDVLIDGERLEGRGVEPDIAVPFELPYANGADPQLDAALEALTRS